MWCPNENIFIRYTVLHINIDYIDVGDNFKMLVTDSLQRHQHHDGSLYTLTSNRLKEKSRVVRPGPDERNYHIFYQLVAAAQSDPQVSLNLNLTKDVFP